MFGFAAIFHQWLTNKKFDGFLVGKRDCPVERSVHFIMVVSNVCVNS